MTAGERAVVALHPATARLPERTAGPASPRWASAWRWKPARAGPHLATAPTAGGNHGDMTTFYVVGER
ncbi:MAG: hypothetical protein M5U09_18265 [Gammaproteobacteria bacterium]|nr:hypothetical protein [Gammaproteobacteria bacterium]